MSEIKVNKISQRSGTAITLGNSGTDFQLPSGADIVAQSGSVITIAAGATITNNGTASGFGPTGAVSWNTTKITANPNPAVSGVGYFCDTSSAAFTVTLPAAPSAGAIVALSDYTGTFATNSLTIGRNGSNINAAATDLVLNVNNTTTTLIYVDATEGWRVIDTGSLSEVNNIQYITATGGTITTCGDYKIHSFTGPGTFTVTSVGNPFGSTTVDYMVVAGGGGGGRGGAGEGGGGGGAGGYRESSGTASGSYTVSPLGSGVSALPVSVTSYPITVGAGGPGVPSGGACTTASNGNPSVFSTITSTAGGGGKSQFASPGTGNAQPGGSGGGGNGQGPQGVSQGGTGNTPPVSPSQGNNGGLGSPVPASTNYSGGGGGGATSSGNAGYPAAQGNPAGPGNEAKGGLGATSSINGTPTTRAGGGGGGSAYTHNPAPSGGAGAGAYSPGIASTAATSNTGSGGGAGSGGSNAGSNGGSGIVVIRYKFQ